MSIQQNINQMLSSMGIVAGIGKALHTEAVKANTAAKESEARLKAEEETKAKKEADIKTLQELIQKESGTLEHLKQPNQQGVKNITQKRYEQGIIVEQLRGDLYKLDPSVLNKRELELAKMETSALQSATERWQKAVITREANRKAAQKGGK